MKIWKRVALAVVALAVIGAAASGLYGLKMKSERNRMSPADTKEIAEGIYIAEDDNFVNMYLLKSGNEYIAIDSASSVGNIAAEMNKLKIAPEKVAAVFLTHTDYDHVGALELFKNAKVYISAAEEQMINGKTARAAGFAKNKLKHSYEMIADNQVIDISGLKVKGILTPGHTPGSMSYIVNNKYLFTGDTLSLKDGKAQLFNEFFNMDSTTEEKSIQKLSDIPDIGYIFTAHYGYSDNFEKVFKANK